MTAEKKTEILTDAANCELNVLIATSAAGAGINLPVVGFVGWGLDKLTSGIIHSQGRAGRYPLQGEATVILVHNPVCKGGIDSIQVWESIV